MFEIQEILVSIAIIIGSMVLISTVVSLFGNNLRETIYQENDDNKWKKKKSYIFKKNKYKNFCGIEIEAINEKPNKNNISMDLVSRCGDSSLNEGGKEFRTEPTQGDELINLTEDLCKELNNKKWKIDSSCGLHIHLEIERDLETIKKLYLFYKKFEDQFFRMMPKSRRENKYCKRINDKKNIKDFYKAHTLEEFMKLYYETNWYISKSRNKYSKKRYCWINLHSVFYRGTLEVRLHSGTIDSKKINNWLLINLSIYNKIKGMGVDKIYEMESNDKGFLKLLDTDLCNYVKSRWKEFEGVN